MTCPFCAEDIRDDATVCRHCRRDLSLVRTLSARVTALESELLELRSQLPSAVEPSPETTAGRPALPTSRLVIAIVVTMTANASATACFIYDKLPRFGYLSLLIILPAVVGLCLGIRYASRFRTSALTGILIGIVPTAWFVVMDGIAGRFNTYDLLTFSVIAGFILVPAMLFASGRFLGGWLYRLLSPQRTAGRIATQLATQVVGGLGPRSTRSSERMIQQIGTLISAVAPILTFIASLIAAYFTYLAAIAKQAGGK